MNENVDKNSLKEKTKRVCFLKHNADKKSVLHFHFIY